jgi:uncharacterized 2Fe-2S/4Fe-4S cluster protein (DUF4445 family)
LKTHTVKIRPSGHEVLADPSLTLLENLQKEGFSVESVCGGKGTCGKCRVRFLKGAPSPSESDVRHLPPKEIEEGWRLACQVKLEGEAEISVAPSAEVAATILSAGRSVRTELDPEARKCFLKLRPQTLERPIGDADLILEKLGMGDLRIDVDDLAELPHLIRKARYRLTVTVAGGEITKIEPGDTTDRNFGLAIDIGTSTLVVCLIDLNTGEEKAVSAAFNPQRDFGADVITRIQQCREGHGALAAMWLALMGKLSTMVKEVCKEAGIKQSDIAEAVTVGNPTMQHIFSGIDPSYIGEMPYAPAICRKMRFRPMRGFGVDIGSYPVETPPNLSGFIGSDIVGGILSQGLLDSEEIQLLVDLGTNAEIVLGNKNRLLVSNAAAGPAFEGAKIECGMIGLKGAIDKVWFDDEDVQLSVMGGGKPIGICGSGLVDAIATLLDLRILDETGKMANPSALPDELAEKIRKRLKKEGREKKFCLSNKVYISQKDVRQVQAAKAAVAAGIHILTKKLGIETNQIARVLIAGAFGSYVNPKSAKRIGLIPDVPLDRVISVGNSALEGAKMYLLSRRVRKTADEIHKIVELRELSAEKDFMQEFVSQMTLGPVSAGRRITGD